MSTLPVRVPLSRGLVALVDACDAERVLAFRWWALPNRSAASERWYAARTEGQRTIYMHRFILGAPVGMQVDHRSGDGLDNRRANLRLCSRAENLRNSRPRAGKRFKGCSYSKAERKWRAEIAAFLGYYDSEIEAARAYDCAASLLFGEFARLNLPQDANPSVEGDATPIRNEKCA